MSSLLLLFVFLLVFCAVFHQFPILYFITVSWFSSVASFFCAVSSFSPLPGEVSNMSPPEGVWKRSHETRECRHSFWARSGSHLLRWVTHLVSCGCVCGRETFNLRKPSSMQRDSGLFFSFLKYVTLCWMSGSVVRGKYGHYRCHVQPFCGLMRNQLCGLIDYFNHYLCLHVKPHQNAAHMCSCFTSDSFCWLPSYRKEITQMKFLVLLYIRCP